LWRRLRGDVLSLLHAAGLCARLMRQVPDAALRRAYAGQLWRVVTTRPEPKVLRAYVIRCAMHYHYHALARSLAGERGRVVNSI
jgi:hypothetical protein